MVRPLDTLRHLIRASILLTLVATPLALVPAVHAGNSVNIEAPTQAKKGLGLVLLVSLQRA